MNDAIVATNGLSFRYTRRTTPALDHISIAIAAGFDLCQKWIGIVSPNPRFDR